MKLKTVRLDKTFGIPVIFGPNHQKFKEAIDLKSEDGAFAISDYHQLETTINLLLKDKSRLNSASEICRNYVAENVGSTELIIKKIFNY